MWDKKIKSNKENDIVHQLTGELLRERKEIVTKIHDNLFPRCRQEQFV